MNKKSIKAVISRKFNNFLESITDENVKQLVKKNTIVTGGCIASMLLQEEVNDFDLYFTNKETVLAVANYYVEKFREEHKERFPDSDTLRVIEVDDTERVKIFIRSSGVATNKEDVVTDENDEIVLNAGADKIVTAQVEDITDKPKFRPVWLSANAITLSDKIQLVIRFYGDAQEIHTNYDFVHCTSYWQSSNNELVLRPDALEALLAKELRYVGSKYPVCSIMRTRKFLNRGFTINAGQYLKMCLQVSQLNLLDMTVLEDQLIGVDSAYFNQIIDKLKQSKAEDPTFNIDTCYLVEIINKIF